MKFVLLILSAVISISGSIMKISVATLLVAQSTLFAILAVVAILAVFVDPAAEKVTPPTFWAMLAVVTVAADCPFFEHDWRHGQMTLHHLHQCRTEAILRNILHLPSLATGQSAVGA